MREEECGVNKTTDAKRRNGAQGQSKGEAQGQARYSGQASGSGSKRRSSSWRSQDGAEEARRSACRYSLEIGSHREVLGGQLGGVRERPGGSSGVYFGAAVKLAGRIQRVEVGGGMRHAWLILTGTDHEGVLKMCTAQPLTPFQLHLCHEGCGQHESGDRYVHAIQGRKVVDESKEEDWVFNLQGVKPVEVAPVDELADLRDRGEGLAPMDAGVGMDKKKDKASSSSSIMKKNSC